MAATRLMALHINKGKTLAQCLQERTDYASNPEKTEKGELVTAYECDPMTVDEKFLLSKRQYQHTPLISGTLLLHLFMSMSNIESLVIAKGILKSIGRR